MTQAYCHIKKADAVEQIVYAEVYAPNESYPDTDVEFMTAPEIRKAAHKFLKEMKVTKIDTHHDNVENGSVVVESFIARDGDPDFIAGAWVVGVYIPDADLWDQVVKGEINGFSFEAKVIKTPTLLDIEIPESLTGGTCETEGHSHAFTVKFDEDGNFLGGCTEAAEDGHAHQIKRGTVTEMSSDHNHRFSFLEGFYE